MEIRDVLREMRSVQLPGLDVTMNAWADTIEAAKREKDAEIERLTEAAQTFITAMNDCSDYPDTTTDMEGLVYAKRKVEAALAKKEPK